MPKLEDYQRKLERIWESGWLTNDGECHRQLRDALSDYLGVEHVNLCCNGTIALLLALQAARINGGEVITTPFSFPATPHALYWNRVEPVFCDIDETTFNLDPAHIESLIGPDTRAILPVHVFGNPCDVDAIQTIADRHGLTVIYDAAHMMGVTLNGRSVLEWGDFSILSFSSSRSCRSCPPSRAASCVRSRRAAAGRAGLGCGSPPGWTPLPREPQSSRGSFKHDDIEAVATHSLLGQSAQPRGPATS